MIRLLLVAVLLGTLLGCAGTEVAEAAGRTVYVSPKGNDANPGTSDRPFRAINAALAVAQPSDRISVAAGSYPKVTDDRARTGTVELAGAGPATTKVAGMDIAGGQGLEIHGFGFTTTVKITEHLERYSAQPAANVTLRNSDVTTPESASTCAAARGRSASWRTGSTTATRGSWDRAIRRRRRGSRSSGTRSST